MSINSIETATRFSGELDKVLVQKSAVGFLSDNAFSANFVGAKTVKIPSIELQGLGDYDRDSGFLQGTVTVSNTAYEMKQDRARSFQIDREDMDETGVANLAGEILGEFVRTKVCPETDAYVISKLAGIAFNRNHVVSTDDAKNAYEAFVKMQSAVQEEVGFDEELVAFVDSVYWANLKTSSEISKAIDVSEFKQGDINLKVRSIDGIPIIPVSSARMKTAFEFAANSAGGFVPADNAKEIRMLMLPKKAAMLIKKSEKVRMFTPEQNLKADAYKFDYRIYYDVFVKTAYIDSVFAYVDAASIAIVGDDVDIMAINDGGILSVNAVASREGAKVEYQWYCADDENKTNAQKIVGATNEELDVQTILSEGTYYVYCVVTVDGYFTKESKLYVVTE